LNVFPQKEAPPAPEQTAHQRGNGPPSLYWFSQTIGPGRGLEAVIEAVGRMRLPAHLHLRGVCSQGYQNTLEALAGRIGMKDRLHLHPPASPEQMAVLAAGHDLGLALELNQPPNRALCLTNKIFTYLLAGIPVLLSRTPAQERLAPELGPAAILVNLADPGALAVRLDAFFADAEQQRSARSCAWQLGQERFNWDVEQRTFLGSVRRALGMKVDESPGDR